MFENCSRLNSVSVGCTGLLNYTYWLIAVAPTGTVHFLNGLAAGYTPPTGVSGIPEGWTYDESGLEDFNKYMTMYTVNRQSANFTVDMQGGIESDVDLYYRTSSDLKVWDGDWTLWSSSSTIQGACAQFKITRREFTPSSTTTITFSCNSQHKATGDARSLLPEGCDETRAFFKMFLNDVNLVSAKDLNFKGSLNSIGDRYMAWCFKGCTSLTECPKLPWSEVGSYSLNECFSGCTSLTNAPNLPADTLGEACYNYMFNGCTSLTAAPPLYATTLVTNCYSRMFNDCSMLNRVDVYCTNLGSYTANWLAGVSQNGTVYFSNGLDAGYTPPTGVSGIPEGWNYIAN